MKKFIVLFLSLGFVINLTGCQNMKKQDVGVITGGAVGALVGHHFGKGSGRAIAVAAGAIGGALIGGSIGSSMDKVDQMQVNRALETNPTDRTNSWINPDNGNSYSVTPVRTYRSHHKYCREYITKARINGKRQKVYGKACRQPDGSWKVVN